ncbi:hypothetical protein P11VFA_013 [Rhizobium phage P11VFA]|nr:hypothetical protein P11VFA_013 [Rhizobium phage P11VFA]
MSRVSNFCIIGPSAYEGDYLQQLNNALFDLGTNDQFFSHLTGEGGAKHYEWFIYGMAGDFMDETMVMAAMQAVPWENPAGVILVYKEQDDEAPHVLEWRESMEDEPVVRPPPPQTMKQPKGSRKTRID